MYKLVCPVRERERERDSESGSEGMRWEFQSGLMMYAAMKCVYGDRIMRPEELILRIKMDD